MKALLTGMNGTVAPALARRLRAAGIETIAWDRQRVPVDDEARGAAFIREHRPDWFFHVAMGSPDWAAAIARTCREDGIRFLFTGTVSVFDGSRPGPFAIDRVPDATDDYGRYKADCERRITAANPGCYIARLGWQIGDAPGSNNMVDFLFRTGREKGRVELSGGVIHSHAHLDDTADALYRLMAGFAPGLYQLEGNPGLSVYEVARRLQRLHKLPFPIVEIAEARRDIRMLDGRIDVAPITKRLPA